MCAVSVISARENVVDDVIIDISLRRHGQGYVTPHTVPKIILIFLTKFYYHTSQSSVSRSLNSDKSTG